MEVMLTLPDSVTFVRAGHEVTFALLGLSESILADLVEHGLIQKVGDAAAGKEGEEALSKMQMTYDALAAGNWGVRRTGWAPRADRTLRHRRDVVKAWWKKWTGTPFKREKGVPESDSLDAQYDSLSDAWQVRVDEEVARRIADEDEIEVEV